MIESAAVQWFVAIASAAVIGIVATQIRILVKIEQIQVTQAHGTAKTSDLEASFAECQRNCRAQSGDYIRTETKLEGMERRVEHLEDLADAGGI